MTARSCRSGALFEFDNLKRRFHRSKDALGEFRGKNSRTGQVRIPIVPSHPNSPFSSRSCRMPGTA
jgi:hypothetical protein